MAAYEERSPLCFTKILIYDKNHPNCNALVHYYQCIYVQFRNRLPIIINQVLHSGPLTHNGKFYPIKLLLCVVYPTNIRRKKGLATCPLKYKEHKCIAS